MSVLHEAQTERRQLFSQTHSEQFTTLRVQTHRGVTSLEECIQKSINLIIDARAVIGNTVLGNALKEEEASERFTLGLQQIQNFTRDGYPKPTDKGTMSLKVASYLNRVFDHNLILPEISQKMNNHQGDFGYADSDMFLDALKNFAQESSFSQPGAVEKFQAAAICMRLVHLAYPVVFGKLERAIGSESGQSVITSGLEKDFWYQLLITRQFHEMVSPGLRCYEVYVADLNTRTALLLSDFYRICKVTFSEEEIPMLKDLLRIVVNTRKKERSTYIRSPALEMISQKNIQGVVNLIQDNESAGFPLYTNKLLMPIFEHLQDSSISKS